MLIGDGVTPGNEGRGYVLRRLLRRAVRSMRLLGVEDPACRELLPVSRDAMKAVLPRARDATATRIEPDRVRRGGGVPAHARRRHRRSSTPPSRETKDAGQPALSGDQAFQLHDTYGFPIDLTLEMAAEQGLAVDEAGFRG